MTTTIAKLAADYDSQPYEILAALDLGTGADVPDEIDDDTEAEYRKILDIIKAQREDAEM